MTLTIIKMSAVCFLFRQLWALFDGFRTEGRDISTRRHRNGSAELETDCHLAVWESLDHTHTPHRRGVGGTGAPRSTSYRTVPGGDCGWTPAMTLCSRHPPWLGPSRMKTHRSVQGKESWPNEMQAGGKWSVECRVRGRKP